MTCKFLIMKSREYTEEEVKEQEEKVDKIL